VPLLIFPPWINRFYILDLNPKKSFVSWAVDQGLSVFMVSWKSADASMAEVTWTITCAPRSRRSRWCASGWRSRGPHHRLLRGGHHAGGHAGRAGPARQADKVASATFFTAQVDFSEAGELSHFIDDAQLRWLESLETDGFLDGRYLAATFNLLRGPDLIWNYVINNYLLGEDYPAFDLLYWNGDTTNLPAKWHRAYRPLSRQPVGGARCAQRRWHADRPAPHHHPCYIQAGREDHIAPPESVWKLTRHLAGPWKFVLAGSGHIAGVVNPPAAGKYQYWTNPASVASLEAFVAGAQETREAGGPTGAPGSISTRRFPPRAPRARPQCNRGRTGPLCADAMSALAQQADTDQHLRVIISKMDIVHCTP
jgi:polyhydroxyalkanoate synthase